MYTKSTHKLTCDHHHHHHHHHHHSPNDHHVLHEFIDFSWSTDIFHLKYTTVLGRVTPLKSNRGMRNTVFYPGILFRNSALIHSDWLHYPVCDPEPIVLFLFQPDTLTTHQSLTSMEENTDIHTRSWMDQDFI